MRYLRFATISGAFVALFPGSGCFELELNSSNGEQTAPTSVTTATQPSAPSAKIVAGYPLLLGLSTDDTDGNQATRLGTFRSTWGVAADVAAGVLYIGDSTTLRKYTLATGDLETIVGKQFEIGYTNGTGIDARLYSQSAGIIKVGDALYIAEDGDPTAGHTSGSCAIRKIDISTRQVTTLAGPLPPPVNSIQSCGYTDGAATAARFTFRNQGASLTSDGTSIFASDSDNHAIRQVSLADGSTTTIAGAPPPSPAFGDGTTATGTAARFYFPYSVFYSPLSSALFVGDGCNGLMRKVTLPGHLVTTFTGSTTGGASIIDGTGSGVLHYSCSLRGGAIDTATDRIYLSDGNAIRELDPGAQTVTTRAGDPTGVTLGQIDGSGTSARLGVSGNVAIVGDYLYFTQAGSLRRMHRTSFLVETIAGAMPDSNIPLDGTGTAARFSAIQGMTSDPQSGAVYVFEGVSGRSIRKLDPANGWVLTTVAGVFATAGTGYLDGVGNAARLGSLRGGVFVGGLLYFLDATYCSLRTFDPLTQTVTTVAGQAPPTATGGCAVTDGTGTAARFNVPQSVVHLNGALFVTESNGTVIRKVSLPGLVVTTLAGLSGSAGFADGQGSTARFSFPHGIVAGNDGMLYVSDAFNNAIRRVDPNTGDVLTVAGPPPPTGASAYADGVGTAARFKSIGRIFVDSATGRIFIADTGVPALRVFSPSTGQVSTHLGLPSGISSVGAVHSPGKAVIATTLTVSEIDL